MFLLQGIGILSAAIVSIITLASFHNSIVNYGEPVALPSISLNMSDVVPCWNALFCTQGKGSLAGNIPVEGSTVSSCSRCLPCTGGYVAERMPALNESILILKVQRADINYLDYVWRIIIGFGALPAVATIYLRSTLPETPRYTTDVECNDNKALRNITAVKNNDSHFVDEYSEPEKMDRISAKKLHRYLTYPSILRNRCENLLHQQEALF